MFFIQRIIAGFKVKGKLKNAQTPYDFETALREAKELGVKPEKIDKYLIKGRNRVLDDLTQVTDASAVPQFVEMANLYGADETALKNAMAKGGKNVLKKLSDASSQKSFKQFTLCAESLNVSKSDILLVRMFRYSRCSPDGMPMTSR